ncbi:MAG: GNAT family N-acetyltransferase, partial [Clostridia bacterium]|nr:GNAT family N-acetyltransferase [Clostridia bacterium]
GNKQIATFAIRDESHLSLAFVDKYYHRKGVATLLWNEALSYISQNRKIEEVTVNSSPYGLPFYKKIGFKEVAEEHLSDGIRYIPMKYIIERQ